MSTLIVSTDRLISSSEARKKFGQLVEDVSTHKGNYFVILDNGKVAALLVSPDWLNDKQNSDFPDMENIRKNWSHYTANVAEALDRLDDVKKEDLPSLLR